MKKVIINLRNVLLVNIMLISVTHVFGQTNGTEKGVYIAGDATVDSLFEASLPEIVWTQEALTRTLPSSVDNSLLQEGYMPPIFSQDSSCSCVQCAEIGYVLTYEINRYRGVAAGSRWYGGTENEMQNLYHPFFTYNFLNKGSWDSYTNYGSGFTIVVENGCPSLVDYYDPVLNPPYYPSISQLPFRYWMDGAEKYISATENCIDFTEGIEPFKITWGETVGSLDSLKRWLCTHNTRDEIGGLAIISVKMPSHISHYTTIPAGNPHEGDSILMSWASSGGHALTIVGYDDDIWVSNNHVQPEANTPLANCERGAFKVANSWGDGWKNNGYIWVPYKLLAGNQLQYNHRAYTCRAAGPKDKKVFLTATVAHPRRQSMQLRVGIGENASKEVPDSTIFYNIFNYQGGYPQGLSIPINGDTSNPCSIDLAVNFGEKYSPYNCGKYFLQVIDNNYYTSNYTNGTAYVNNLRLIDYRWEEVFELNATQPYAIIQKNSTTTLSVNYDLIYPFNIVQNYTCATNKVARRTVKIDGNSTFAINDEVYLDMYGTDAYDCNIIVKAGSTLSIGDNAVITAKRGRCRIEVRNGGNIIFGEGARFRAENGASFDIVINGQQLVSIVGCHFFGTTLTIQSNNSAMTMLENNNTVSIVGCTFRTSSTPCDYAFRIEGYANLLVMDNSVNDFGILSPAYRYGFGMLIYNCGFSGLNNQVFRNTIQYCNDAGLILFGTTANVKMNQITQCGYGVKLLNGSTVNEFMGNCAAFSPENTQNIYDNEYGEVFVHHGSMPQTFRFNRITSSDTGYFFEYDDTGGNGDGLNTRLDLEYNNWGSSNNEPTSNRFHYITDSNNGMTFDFVPKWGFGECLSSYDEEAQRASAEADSLWGLGLHSSAKTSYKEIVALYPNTTTAVNVLKKLLILEAVSDGDFAALKYYYLNDSIIHTNERLTKTASSLANKCDEILGNYEDAIEWYEAVIYGAETSYNDSIFATIDLGNLLLFMGNSGAKGVPEKLAQFVPNSPEVFRERTDEALRHLKSSASKHPNRREFPDQYWTDLVTEQPEGYVVYDNGDVHLYSAEALAWLISVTNGLNGQETDDFDDKSIYLEENINLSAALWIPIAGKNTIIDGFKGRFDGKEHVIDGLTMTNGISNYWAMGLFGKTSEATLSNIILKNGYYETQSQSNSEGGFLANKVHKSTIEHCFVECEMHIHEGMSPFVYLCDSSVIYNCLVHVPLYRSSGWVTAIPGIFAAMSSPTSHIYNCASIIEQMDWSEYCGLVGMFNAGIIENCYAYIHEILNFPGYGGGSGLGPRNGITGSNIGEVYNCYYNRIRNFDPAFSGYYMQLDDSPGEGDNFYNASPFVEEGRGHWKLTEEIAFALEGGMVTTNDLLDALNLKVEELENETLLSWCDTGMNFENQLLPVFCDFDVTKIKENVANRDKVELYPNPTNYLVRIKGITVVEARICNILGQIVKVTKNTNEINLKDLPKGVYLLRITDENGAIATKKVVVE